jgi:D-glycero-D-manno-heptose 1,7-bisphosphate phosphatase
MARLIILDRDGVINFDSPGFIKSPEEWRPIPRALEAIAALKHAGWLVAVCTNQSGIGRGLLSHATLDAIHARMLDRIALLDATLDSLSYCPHLPEEGCRCRKPAPGMLLDTIASLGATPEQTIAIGDSQRDIEAGIAAGCGRCVLVRTGNGAACEAGVRALGVDWVFDDLGSAARAILTDAPTC